MCTVATLPDLRRLRVTSDAVSRILHLIDMPSSADIEIICSFCNVSDPGVNVFSCLHADLPWIKFLDETRDVTVLHRRHVCQGEEIAIVELLPST